MLWHHRQVQVPWPFLRRRRSPPPLVVVAPPARADVLILPIDTAAGDSIRLILERDLENGDWLHVLPLDSVSRALAVVHAIRTGDGLDVELIDGRTLRSYRSQHFSLPSSPWGLPGRTERGPPAAHDPPRVPAPAPDATERWRWAVHGVADALQEWITGHRGIAQSRIVYVSHNALHIVDADGAHDHAVTASGIALSPVWSHDGRMVAYADLNSDGSRIVELDLARRTRRVAALRGLNITPLYTPDDRWIVFAHGDDNGTTLVAVRRDGSVPPMVLVPRRQGSLSSPTFRADGRRLAFAASGSTTPQIYSVNVDGSDERLETPYLPGVRSYRASPDWSPDGGTIAFEQQQHGTFQVWLLALSGHVMRQVTSVGENEDPTWAPDARHLAFTSMRRGDKNIWILDVPSGRFRQLTRTGNARLAAWSPRVARTDDGTTSW